jgi:hypothetical protein
MREISQSPLYIPLNLSFYIPHHFSAVGKVVRDLLSLLYACIIAYMDTFVNMFGCLPKNPHKMRVFVV